ncbi:MULTISPECIES: helix-turn-helix domain-containing protein [unclassified Nocardia]|uniref:helix-turn-helix domain-containing protein n=1 Tax=unclassified Nocardia TaxID=2637762 RepID=UPI00278BFE6F|nr:MULTISPECIES: helix-turn-helix domain-containing protein [unclassified Nocardia]
MGYTRPRGPWNRAFAQEVVHRRHSAGLSQREVYERAGLSRSTYTKFELDQTVLTMDQIALVAETLGVHVDDLARGARFRVEAAEHLDLPESDIRAMSSDTLERLLGERNSFTRSVAAGIRGELARRGMTMEDLAVAARMELDHLTPRLRGEQALDLDDITSIARAFDLHHDDLLRLAATAARPPAHPEQMPAPVESALVYHTED